VRVSANRSESSDYEDGAQVDVASAWKKWNADASFGWTPDAETALELTVGTGDAQARYAGRGMDGSQFRRNSLGLRFEKILPGTLQKISANAYRNEADHVMDNYNMRTPNPMGAMPMPMASNVMRTTKGGRAAAEWQWEQFALTAGADTQHSAHRRRHAMGVGAYLQQPWLHDATFRNTGLFAEGTWNLQHGDKVISGLRMDRAEVTDGRPTIGNMGMRNPSFAQQRRETLPAGFLRYEHEQTDATWGWYAGIGHTQRMPDYWELFSPDRGPVGSVNAFSGVRPEKTTQLDIGAQWRGQRSHAWVSAYAGRIEDFILFQYMDGGMMGRTSMASNVDARIHGAEAGAEFRPNAQWAFGGSVAWAWGANTTQGSALPQMTPLEGRLTFAWEQGRWNVGGLLRGVAAQTRIAVNQGNVVGRDLGSSAGFAMLSVNAGYRLNERLQLTAGVDNALDRTYSEHLNLAGNADFGYPADPLRIHEPGRSVWVKLNFSL
jgi:iron complex outermembrane recepter protein